MLFIKLYRYFELHSTARNFTLFVFVALCALSASRISFEENISRMFGDAAGSEYLALFAEKNRSSEQLLMRVWSEAGDPDRDSLIACADILTGLVESQCGEFLDGFNAGTDTDELAKIYAVVVRNFPSFVAAVEYPSMPERLDSSVAKYLNMLASPGSGTFAREGLLHDPAGFSFDFLSRLNGMQTESGFRMIDGRLFSDDGTNLIILMTPANRRGETGNNAKLVSRLDGISRDFNAGKFGYASFQTQYFGAPLVAVGNSERITKDIRLTVAVMLVCVVVLLVSVFGTFRMLFLVPATIAFSALFSLALVALVQTEVSLIAAGAGAVILGVVANYPVHFFTHFKYCRGGVEATVRSMIFPMTVGSFTTAGGFLCLVFTDSPILRDFGLFGAFSLVGAVLFSLVFLPHLAGRASGFTPAYGGFVRRTVARFRAYRAVGKTVSLLLIVVLTPMMLYFAFGVEYERDLNRLNYMSEETREAEARFNELAGSRKMLTLVSKGRTPDEALDNSRAAMRLTDSLAASGVACSYIGPAKALPSRSEMRANVERWNRAGESRSAGERERILAVFHRNGLNPDMFGDFFATLDGMAREMSEEDYGYLSAAVCREWLYSDSTVCTLLSTVRTPEENRHAIAGLVNAGGHTAALDRQTLASNMVSAVCGDFNSITLYTSLLVFAAILLSYGRIELTLISFVPMLVSWIWILGFMGLFGIRFNIVNIILSTFIFGLGDDFCIFTTDGCLKSFRTKENHTSVARAGILVSGLTGMAGFGSLLFAEHPAIRSLSVISALGIASVIFVSQTLQPLLFRILVEKPVARGHAPVSFLTLINSAVFFGYFFAGSVLLSLTTVVLKMLPMRRRVKKLLLHLMMHHLCRFLDFITLSVRKITLNPHGETFRKPAIIVANHQSMIDILRLLILSPRIVFVVKGWVWRSPVMGLFVRFAGFHTLPDVQGSLECYSRTLKEGYSIAVFPEGSRTEGDRIRRFHKGAFFLAQRLDVDIIPVVMRHNAAILPKNSFAIYPGQTVLMIDRRISPRDPAFGPGYRELAKSVSTLFRERYAELGETTADAAHCVRRLRDAFMYRGPVLEWYLRIKLKIEDAYADFEKFVPPRGKIIDAGCGYGFLSCVLSLRHSERRITAVDYDAEKIAVARRCYPSGTGLTFVHADLKTYGFEAADCFIFCDVLHYLDRESTEELARKLARKLNPGGVIVIRDADAGNREFNRVAEFFSTRVVRFNRTENELNFLLADDICRIFAAHGFETEIVESRKFAVNTYVIARLGN
jgi:1-acyl-sn-glycerol-3-phosphate acyltransferase